MYIVKYSARVHMAKDARLAPGYSSAKWMGIILGI